MSRQGSSHPARSIGSLARRRFVQLVQLSLEISQVSTGAAWKTRWPHSQELCPQATRARLFNTAPVLSPSLRHAGHHRIMALMVSITMCASLWRRIGRRRGSVPGQGLGGKPSAELADVTASHRRSGGERKACWEVQETTHKDNQHYLRKKQ